MGHKERTTGTWKTNYEMGGRHEETSRKPMDQNSEKQKDWKNYEKVIKVQVQV
jgi:hypothetical protein